jgi:hypothetical protein
MVVMNPELTAEQHRAAQSRLEAEMLAEMERDWPEL